MLKLEVRELEAPGLDDNFRAAGFTLSTPDVGAICCVSGVTKSALTPDCSLRLLAGPVPESDGSSAP